MRILISIVHHWDPEGDRLHQSTRPDPRPRRLALKNQLLSLQRLGLRQGQLDIAQRKVTPVNQMFKHEFDIRIVTDGSHTVLDQLDTSWASLAREEVREPISSMHLGFEGQKLLAENIDGGFDLFAYLEDDLIINDPLFFHKINWFANELGDDKLLLPHRVELSGPNNIVNRLYIDGPLPSNDLKSLIPDPCPPLAMNLPLGPLYFTSPLNPHSGCFVLSQNQLSRWVNHSCWQDEDCSYVSPLESAASLGLSKVFGLYKPATACASWLELQHWGTSFTSLIGGQIPEPSDK